MQELERRYREKRTGLLAFLNRRLPDGEEAEDTLQDVFLQGLEAAAGGTVLEDAVAWLFTVARRRIADAWRGRERQSDADLDDLADSLVSDELSPEDNLLAEEAAAAVRTALAVLPPEQREVLVLHVLEDLPFREIAEIQGVSINTATARKRYALRTLRKELSTLNELLEEEAI